MTAVGVSMPMLSTPVEKFPVYAQLADDAGFRSLWDYEFYRNPFMIHATTAAVTSRIRLATGIAEAFIRSPFEAANAAADLDELSGGRTIMGIGPGGPDFLEGFHSTNAARPVARMREYVDLVRLTWRYLGDGAPPLSYEGEHYRFRSPPLNPWGGRALARARIPIYLSAMRPRMLQLAGEIADGTLGYLQTPEYIEQAVRPNLIKGAQRAGRDPAEVDHAALVICSVSDDRAEALRRARIQVGMYVAYPISDVSVQFHGCEAEQAAIRQAMMAGGIAAIEGATADKLVGLYALAGTPDEVRKQARRYEGALQHIVLHTPYVPPLTADETEDAFRNIVATFGD
jgi:alkanesulfonate monooxygenase SsuD/methylene tetrahydromethanopterin reductase-like flavin-dependent oxidoreductase (luciferase family)